MLSLGLNTSLGAVPPTLGPGFSPEQLANLATWYDASDAATITKVSDKVSLWADRANSHDFSQDNDTYRPTYINDGLNDLPTIQFDGVDDIMLATSFDESIINSTSGYSLFMVLENAVVTDSGSFMNPILELGTYIASSDRGKIIVHQPRDDTNKVGSYSNGSGALALSFDVGTTAYVYNEEVTSGEDGSVTVYRNNTEEFSYSGDTTDVNDTQASYYLMVGGDIDSSTRRFYGKISEILIFSQQLSDADRQKVNNYLKNKWSI